MSSSGENCNLPEDDEEWIIDEDRKGHDFPVLELHSWWKKIQLLRSRLVSTKKLKTKRCTIDSLDDDWAWRNTRFRKKALAAFLSLLKFPDKVVLIN